LHTSDLNDGTDWNKLNLTSVTEQNSLDEFLNNAELAGTDFDAEKLNVKFVSMKKVASNAGVLTKEEEMKVREVQEKHKEFIKIPRRPFWKTHDYDAVSLARKERESFLEWRRNLALIQEKEHITMTPFEKNLEFWRQLWRVIDKSDVILQIVDARNPLLFHCDDLEKYVKEVDENKINVILINKSDFLSQWQRLTWLKHFESKGIKVIFWSALAATVDELTETESDNSEDENDGQLDEEEEYTDDENDDKNFNKFNVLLENDGEENESSSPIPVINDKIEEFNDSAVVVTDELQNEFNKDKEAEEEEDTEKEEEIEADNKQVKESLPTDRPQLTPEEIEKCKILTRIELIDFLKTVHTGGADKKVNKFKN
jgi:large subunit GTPase 1